MGFDVDKFMSTQFIPREDKVEITEKELLKLFGVKKLSWKVRGLKGVEMARCEERRQVNKNIKAVIEALASDNMPEKVHAFKEMFGVGDGVPPDIAYRTEALVIGSVDPVCDYPLASKLCETFFVEYFEITNKIINISGRGHIPGKVEPSIKTKKSEQH